MSTEQAKKEKKEAMGALVDQPCQKCYSSGSGGAFSL